MSSIAVKIYFVGDFLIYIKYAVCDGDDISRHQAAEAARDYILSEVFNVQNAEKLICKTDKGKPYIKGSDFDFSLAHTDTVAIAAVCGNGRKAEGLIRIDEDVSKIGIDIEAEERRLDSKSIKLISEKFFSEKELDYVKPGFCGESQRFLEIWTRKESIVKATGEGLSAIHNADSFSDAVKYLKTKHLFINNKKYIISVAGI